MTPEDYELMNNMLIAQSGRDEIVIQQQAERTRDLEAKLEAAQKDAAYWKKLYTQLGFSGTPAPPTLLHRDR